MTDGDQLRAWLNQLARIRAALLADEFSPRSSRALERADALAEELTSELERLDLEFQGRRVTGANS